MSKSWRGFTAVLTVVFTLTMASSSESSHNSLTAAQQPIKNSFNSKITLANLATTSASLPNPITKIAQQTNTSTTAQIALSSHLKKIGAKFYGAFWCPYCTRQKAMFGEQAFRQINYIECDARGNNPRPDLCRKANLTGFPTWEINGKQYRGMKSLQELADLSGYKGSRNFAN